jgi:hypothetical protein
MSNNGESATWLQDAAQAINEATKEAKPGTTINVTLTYAPVTNIDNRQVNIYNGRSTRRPQSLCHPSRPSLTGGYLEQLSRMTEAERNALWDSQRDSNFIY